VKTGQDMYILLAGTGTAATNIVEGIAAGRLGTIAAVVDPMVSNRSWAQDLASRGLVYKALHDVSSDLAFDAAGVAVPTPLHFDVLSELLRSPICPPLVLSEKPLTTTGRDAAALRHLAASRGISLRTLLHFGLSPEVVWFRGAMEGLSEHLGPLIEVVSHFGDNYIDNISEARARLGGSWLDSGVNSLSVVLQFVKVSGLLTGKAQGHRSVVRFAGTRGEDVSITTTWDDVDRRKYTRLVYSKATVVLDHVRKSVSLDDAPLHVAAVGKSRIARYGSLMHKHLRGQWTAEDEIFERQVMDWLHAGDDLLVSTCLG